MSKINLTFMYQSPGQPTVSFPLTFDPDSRGSQIGLLKTIVYYLTDPKIKAEMIALWVSEPREIRG